METATFRRTLVCKKFVEAYLNKAVISNNRSFALKLILLLVFIAPPITANAEIVVTGSRVPVPAKELGSAVTVIDAEQLEQRQVRVLSDVLRDVPGIAVSRTGPTGSFTQLRLRGAEGNQTLVMIDGFEINNPSGGSEYDFANALNAEIERIEVVRGPQSALFGSDAIGGVINIITKKADPGFSLKARADTGRFDTNDGVLSFGYGGEKFNITGVINRHETDGISVADKDNGNIEDDDYENTSSRIKASFTPFDNLELEAIVMDVDSEREGDASVPVVGAGDSEDESETDQKYYFTKAQLSLFDGKWENILRWSKIENFTDFINGAGVTTFTSDGTKRKVDFQSNLYFSIPGIDFAQNTLSVGYEREKEEADYPTLNLDLDVTNRSRFAEYRVGLWDQLFLSLSGRWDDNDIFRNARTWRATAAYLVEATNTRFHASKGKAVKNPTFFELFGFTPTFTGNPNLSTEEGRGWDAGIEQTFLDGKVVFDVTYFENDIRDLITGSGMTSVNLPGTSEIEGLEVSASVTPIPNLNFTAAYTYTDAENSMGDELVRRAKDIASLSANYNFSLFGRDTNFNTVIRYNGKQDDTQFNPFPAPSNTVRLDDFTLVNIGISHNVAKGIAITGRVENLLDDNYQEVLGFGTPGRAAFVGLDVKLDDLL